jgi:hypothetical protein
MNDGDGAQEYRSLMFGVVLKARKGLIITSILPVGFHFTEKQ